jgi:3-hydroxy-5-phosphonooxypentane-2,4-dione thiolase
MDWGLKNRLAQIIKPHSGRGVMLAVDHGYFLGPTERLEIPRQTIQPLLPYADSLMLTRGVLRTSVDARYSIPIVLRMSGGSSIIGKDLSNEKITTSVKEAIRLNASALALSIFVGAPYEHESLVNLGKLVDEGEENGIPVLAVTAVGKELEKRDARYLSLSCRIAAEFGAHIVKTYFCENFEKVVNSCPVPVIIAGGPKLDSELEALQLTYDALHAGAVGVDMGRNIWQSDFPVPMIKAVRALVHQRVTVKEAHEIFIKNKTFEKSPKAPSIINDLQSTKTKVKSTRTKKTKIS